MRVVVVGAGLAGLAAARSLVDAGHDTVVLDKGRSPGGRLATRRIAGARVDHGAQFFTVRAEPFASQVERWRSRGLVRHWCDGFLPGGDGHPRYVGTEGMNALAKDLARGLDVRCPQLVFTIRPDGGGFEIVVDDGTTLPADAVIMTPPLPQTASLLVDTGINVPEALWRTEYDRTIALLAVLDGPSAVPPPGGLTAAVPDGPLTNGPFSFVSDHVARQMGEVPALTCHADATWSERHWDTDPDEALAVLIEAAAEWIGTATVVEAQLKRWRFATPRTLWPDPCWRSPDGNLVLAGDAFAGPRATGSNLEGAYTSGVAAATELIAG